MTAATEAIEQVNIIIADMSGIAANVAVAVEEQNAAVASIAANDALLKRLEGLDDEQLASFRLALFGRDLDIAGLLRMRISEHAIHTWDIAVTLDPAAELAPESVELLIDGLADTVALFQALGGGWWHRADLTQDTDEK